jgi:GT2 family glycosyltransferase
MPTQFNPPESGAISVATPYDGNTLHAKIDHASILMQSVGVIVIGRNEGERLRRCLSSLVDQVKVLVYVDSGSSDDSVKFAESIGASVVALDLTSPFTAARARNAGVELLSTISPGVDYLQFVDGDCELSPEWLQIAVKALEDCPEITAVAGRLHERHPEKSIFNRLGDLEWNQAGFGEVSALGGIFLIRKSAFDDVNGFDPSLPAGEEPELCARLISRGAHLVRLDQTMAWHDLGMTSFRQWWVRHSRNGYGGLNVTQRCGITYFKKGLLRARLWVSLPMIAITTAWLTSVFLGISIGLVVGAAILMLLPAQLLRLVVRAALKGQPLNIAVPHAIFTMIANWPNVQGQLQYLKDSMLSKTMRLIEYKAQ